MERKRGKSSNAKSQVGVNKRVHDIDRGGLREFNLDTDSDKDPAGTDILNREQERVGNSPNVTGAGETSHSGGMMGGDFNPSSEVERSP